MPRGASRKREREYRELERRFEQEHRYPGREKEVAARIVNKQRRLYGETKEEQEKDRQGKSPDRGLPLPDYQKLTVRQVERRMDDLTRTQLRRIRAYELTHKQRKTLLSKIDRQLSLH